MDILADCYEEDYPAEEELVIPLGCKIDYIAGKLSDNLLNSKYPNRKAIDELFNPEGYY